MSHTYRFRYWESRVHKDVKGVEYYDPVWLSGGCNKSYQKLSFWLGAPQEPIEEPYYQRPQDSFYYDGLKIVDYHGYTVEPYLVSYSDTRDIYICAPQTRSLSFWLGQEVEELVIG